MNKSQFAGLAISMAIFGSSSALAAENSPKVEVSTQAYSQYVNRVGARFSQDSYVLGSVGASYRGFSLKAAKLLPLAGGDGLAYKDDFRNEADYTAGYATNLTEKVSLAVDVVHRDFIRKLAATEWSAEIGYEVVPGVTPFVRGTYVVLNKNGKDAAWYFAGAHVKQAVGKVNLNGTAEVFYDDGAYGMKSTYGYSLAFEPAVKLTENLAVNASLRLVGPFGEAVDRETEVVVGAGLAATF
jgi:hypothetical protein